MVLRQVDGDYIAYHENNSIKEIGQYSMGNRKGKWKEFYENGELSVLEVTILKKENEPIKN